MEKLISLLVVIVFVLCGCSIVIENTADELVMSDWKKIFDNGIEISLSFSGDNATLVFVKNDEVKASLSGFCEVSKDTFVIHDNSTGIAYTFKYVVHFDKIDIIYGETTLSLSKIQ